MKKILTILIVLAVVYLTSSCQKELPESLNNVEIGHGDDTPNNPPQQDNIPSENDNPLPDY